MSLSNEMAAMFVSLTSPVGVRLFSYVNSFFCSDKVAQMLATSENSLYCIFTGQAQKL